MLSSFANTFFVSFGASAIAISVAIMVAVLPIFYPTRFGRFLSTMLPSFALIPTYAMAGAWSAGFGSQGWWTLSQVTSAKAPLVGLASVIWIHACAATPLVFCAVHYGLLNLRPSSLQLATLEGSRKHLFLYGIWPQWRAIVLTTFIAMAGIIAGDMVVTNLFQVQTLAERSYLSLTSGQPLWSSFIVIFLWTFLMGAIATMVIGQSRLNQSSIKVETNRPNAIGLSSYKTSHSPIAIGDHYLLKGGLLRLTGWLFVLLSILSVTIITIVPLVNLILKAGWSPTELSNGKIVREWSFEQSIQSVLNATVEFHDEFYWSVLLCSVSAFIAMFAAWVILAAIPKCLSMFGQVFLRGRIISSIVEQRSKLYQRTALLLAVFAFLIPGPLVNWVVLQLFQTPMPLVRWLDDNTLIAPIVCLQFRLLAIALVGSIYVRTRWQARYGKLTLLERDRVGIRHAGIKWGYYLPYLVIQFVVLFAIGFGDLSSYLLCLPPGVTTVAMRVFDLLHYGVRYKEAGLLLLLVVLSNCLALTVNRRFAKSMLY